MVRQNAGDGSTPGASTKPNDIAEAVGQRTRVVFPGPERTLRRESPSACLASGREQRGRPARVAFAPTFPRSDRFGRIVAAWCARHWSAPIVRVTVRGQRGCGPAFFGWGAMLVPCAQRSSSNDCTRSVDAHGASTPKRNFLRGVRGTSCSCVQVHVLPWQSIATFRSPGVAVPCL